MAMNPRLLRPLATGGFDADAQAYITAVQAADGQALEQGVKVAYNDFITGCKSDGIWDAIKASCILAGARTLAGALTPLKGAAPTNNGPFVSGDYDRETGLIGNGTTKYLDTGRANNADGQNDQHLALWISSASTGGVAYMGALPVANTGSSAIGTDGTNLNTRSRHAAAAGGGSLVAQTGTGFIGISRSASGSYSRSLVGTANTVSVSSNTPSSVNVFVYVTNGGTAYSNGRCAFYSVGSALTLSSLEARLSTLYNAIGAAIP